MCYGITLLIKGGGGERDMCLLDCRCMCGSTVGVWRRAVGPAAIWLLLCGLADGRSGRGKHEEVEGASVGELRGGRGRKEGTIRGTEGRKRRNRGDGRERMVCVTGGLGRGRWTWGNGQRL